MTRLHTLAQLKAGQLQGVSRLKLSEQLREFPREIFELADTLEILDLSNNLLQTLPDDLPRLRRLKILFVSNNQLTELPSILADCPQLTMMGFKANQISHIPENALPLSTRWLILTDNQIESLPDSIGQLSRLEKLMLAGNHLKSLPASLSQCHQLALLRVSANHLQAFPDCVLRLPKLAWFAFAGNPFCEDVFAKPLQEKHHVPAYDLSQFQLGECLGEGASGYIHTAHWRDTFSDSPWGQQKLAIKLFKGQVTSDGYPSDELLACLQVGQHPGLIPVLSQVQGDDGQGLLMPLISQDYRNLGQPPSFDTCTRDVFDHRSPRLRYQDVLRICIDMTSTINHLHAQGILHGDVYAHNVLISPDHAILFGDFGAASPLLSLTASQQQTLKRIELRALAHFIDDMITLDDSKGEALSEVILKQLRAVYAQCLYPANDDHENLNIVDGEALLLVLQAMQETVKQDSGALVACDGIDESSVRS